MEKRCEFCMALRPVVLCRSDAAHLCLPCDAKVHSANALSYRHPRTLVCESCRFHPAVVRCFGHGMFMCHSCDLTHHVSLDHLKKIVSCYVGCPSAKDLARLWGFDLKDDQSVTFSHSAAANSDASSLLSELDGVVSSSRADKVVNDESQQKSSCLILQQIMDLERLQLSEGVDDSCLAHVKERPGGGESPLRTLEMNHHLEHSDGPLDYQHQGSSVDNKTEEPLSSPFTQLDNLTNAGNNPLNGDTFWQYRSPVHNNEVWLQNMQDLGVCDEVQCFDDVNIPDVDLTFRNFEELFGSEQEAPDDKRMVACSYADKHPSFGKIDRAIEHSNDIEKEMVHQQSQPNHHPLSIRPSYSVSSFSVSRITGESSGSDYKDDEVSPTFPTHVPCGSDNTKSGGKENASLRYKEKKVARHEKQGQYTSSRSKSDFKKRGKSQVLKVEGMEGDSRSF
ncbi:hypothetical protein C2S51_030179 [Perilla frutescens var. frutescens]|nr:hypothetical protein C2S51_030179 [Perilla frutescens var. frutescens]